MTPYEEQMYRAQMLRIAQSGMQPPVTMESQVKKELAQPIPQNMINQSARGGAAAADAAQKYDVSGAERRIDAQRDYANMLRGKGAPKGKTVGPSNLYVGPNWGESLEYAVNQGVGGYLAGEANKADTALDEDRTAIARREIEREQANKDRTFGQKDRGLDLTLQGLELDEDQFGRTLGQDASQFTQTLGQDKAVLAEEVRSAGVDEEQGQQALNLEERGVAVDEGALETRPMLDVDGNPRNVRTVADPFNPGRFLTVGENNETLDITGWKENEPSKSSSTTGGQRVYSPARHVDAEGNEFMIGTTGDGRLYDVDAQAFIPPGDFTKQGMREEAPMSQFQLNKAVNSYKEMERDQELLLTDIELAEETWKDAGWSGKADENPLNWLTKQSNPLGGAARMTEDFFSEGSPAGTSYAAGKTVMNTITRLRAGLSQTGSEIENINREAGMDIMSDPEVFMQYWGRLKKSIALDVQNMKEGLSPTVRKELARRKKATGGAGKPPGLTDAEWAELQELEARQ